MVKIIFITGNKYKANSMIKALDPFGIDVDIKTLNTPEIQAATCAEVASFSAQWASNKLGKPVIKADSGLFIEALGGLPGVYTSTFQKLLGPEKVLKLLEGELNRKAYIRYSLAYCEPNESPIVFESGTSGKISLNVVGKEGMLIDYIFIPDGSNKTMGELKDLDTKLRDMAWGDAEAKFAKWFSEKK